MPLVPSVQFGPPGLEGRHQWLSAVAGLSAMLNDLAAVPRIKVDKIPGFYSAADAEDNRQAKTGRRGDLVLPSYTRGKTITYEGRVQARSLIECREVAAGLRGAVAERNLEGTMEITYHPDYATGVWHYEARVIAFDEDEEFTAPRTHPKGPWQHRFVLSLRMSDDRFYFTTPVIVPSQAAGGFSVTHGGNADADPTITAVVAAGATATFSNNQVLVAGVAARLRFVGLPAGDLVLNFNQRTATINGVDAMGYFDESYSTWWNEGVVGLRAYFDNYVIAAGVTSWTLAVYPTAV